MFEGRVIIRFYDFCRDTRTVEGLPVCGYRRGTGPSLDAASAVVPRFMPKVSVPLQYRDGRSPGGGYAETLPRPPDALA
jgi:hypothetical protein